MAETSVTLNVSDIEKSIAFYEGLGFETTERHSYEGEDVTSYASLDLDGAVVELASIAANDDPEFQEWVADPLGAGVMVGVEVDDPAEVDGIHERAVEVGAVIEEAPDDQPFGRSFTLDDPDGYVVSFLYSEA